MPDIRSNYSRTLTLDRASVQQDTRTVEIALSSEAPVERWFGIEILGHGEGEVDLSRMLSGAPLLVGHDTSDQVGVVEDARLDPDRVVRCTVRFGRSARAEEIYQDVLDGIRSKVSVGYQILRYETTRGEKGAPDQVRATLWQPAEASIVAVPADDSVGVGRSLEPEAPAIPTPAVAPVTTEVRMDPITVAAPAAENTLDPRAARVEALQLQAIAERHGLASEARELMASEKSMDEIRATLLGLVATKPIPAPSVDMSTKEAREYSYARALLASTTRAEGQPFARCFEDEVSETITKSLPAGYKSRGGLFVPMSTRAGLDSVNANAGAELRYTEFAGELIELLRNLSAVQSMGARILPGLTSPISFPKQTAGAAAYWLAENGGADATASALTLGTVTLAPKTLQGTTSFSRQLLTQSSVGVEQMVRQDLALAHALAIDKAAIHGTGANNQPTGIYRTTGVSTKAMGGVPTHGKLQDMVTAVATANALTRSLGWMTNPGMAGVFAQTLVAASAGSAMIWGGDGSYENGRMNGYKAVATGQVSAVMNGLVDAGGAAQGIIFGNWNDLLIGYWGAMELITDPYALKKQGMIEVTSFQMADVQIRHAASFCVATGATLS